MTRWTGIVLARSDAAGAEMASRLVTYLHPVAGRPLVWHSVSALAALDPPPERIVVVAGVDLTQAHFPDVPVPVEVVHLRDVDLASVESVLPLDDDAGALVMDAAAYAPHEALETLRASPSGSWLPAAGGRAAAAWVSAPLLSQLFRLPEPLAPPNGVLARSLRIDPTAFPPTLVVADRQGLAVVTGRVRDGLVRALMEVGVSFLLPESVLVDVDVRIGRDSIIYPGVVLEGQTTVGDETVVGPGCRIVDSWVGSGVELRGWNYISHTSIRNRAILEPYVRRGFD